MVTALRRVRDNDAEAIAAIYRAYVLDSRATFELEPPTVAEMAARIVKGGDRYPWLVAIDDAGAVIGYAYATSFRDRPAYRFAVETTVYLATEARGIGVGTALYTALIDVLMAQGFVHAIGAVTLPNAASVALHERMGFAASGCYPNVGYKMGEWASVGLFQRSLNRLADDPAEPLALSACAAWQGIAA